MSKGPIDEALERLIRDRGGEYALWSRSEGLKLTFAELGERVATWRGRLAAVSGGPVGLATGNVAAFPELFFALRGLGCSVVAMDGGQSEDDRLQLATELGIPHLLHRGAAGVDTGSGVRLLSTGASPMATPPGTALVKLTSGSTGQPVGACLSEQALVAGIEQIGHGMEIDGRDRVLIVIPLSHSYGFDSGVLSLAVLGTLLILESSAYPASIMSALEEGGATFFPAVPPIVRTLGRYPWRSLPLRRVICAGGPLRDDVAREFRHRSGLAVHQFYGCTESGGITYERSPEEAAAAGTVGHPLPGVRVALGADGLVQVHSAANALARLGEVPAGGPRVVTTGDRARFRSDGRLELLGRSEEVLNVGGKKVAVAAIESAIRDLPGVEDVVVVGVDDPLRGDRVVAFVVGGDDRLDLADLPPSYQPREVRHLSSLPVTERGKLDRETLRRLAALPRETHD